MSTVYLVEQGEYSDRWIVGVFSDKGDAESMASLMGDSELLEYDLDKYKDAIRAGKAVFTIKFWIDRTGTLRTETRRCGGINYIGVGGACRDIRREIDGSATVFAFDHEIDAISKKVSEDAIALLNEKLNDPRHAKTLVVSVYFRVDADGRVEAQ